MSREEAMKKMQMYDFALEDTILFLDTHPTDRAALKYYEDIRKRYLEAVSDFEEQFGPLTAEDVDVQNGWKWINSPWPWEREE